MSEQIGKCMRHNRVPPALNIGCRPESFATPWLAARLSASFPHLAMWAIVFRHSVAYGVIVRIVPTWAIVFRHSVACGAIVRIVPTSGDVGYLLLPLRGLRRDRAHRSHMGDVGCRLSPLRGLRRDRAHRSHIGYLLPPLRGLRRDRAHRSHV